MRGNVGENVGCTRDQIRFLLEMCYATDMIPGSAKNYTCV
jgi:hypothetical protein